MAPLNASSWKLNAAEKKELEERVKGGEQEAAVKKELQTKKAQANADRKAAAQAVSEKCKLQQQPKAKAKAKSAAALAAPPPGADEAALNDAANKAYYLQVLEDYQLVLSEMGGEAFRSELPLPITTAQDMLLVVRKTRFAGRRLSRQFLVRASTDVPSPSAG